MEHATQTLLDFLHHEGFNARLDDDGDIAFKREGLNYAFCFDRSDPSYGKLLLPNVWSIDSPEEMQRVLAAMNEVNCRIKVVKMHTVRDQVWLTVEMWVDEPADWARYLIRAMRALSHGLFKFMATMDGTLPASAASAHLND